MASVALSLLFIVVMAGMADWALGRWFWPDRRSIYHDLRESERFQESIGNLRRAVERAPRETNIPGIKKSSV